MCSLPLLTSLVPPKYSLFSPYINFKGTHPLPTTEDDFKSLPVQIIWVKCSFLDQVHVALHGADLQLKSQVIYP